MSGPHLHEVINGPPTFVLGCFPPGQAVDELIPRPVVPEHCLPRIVEQNERLVVRREEYQNRCVYVCVCVQVSCWFCFFAALSLRVDSHSSLVPPLCSVLSVVSPPSPLCSLHATEVRVGCFSNFEIENGCLVLGKTSSQATAVSEKSSNWAAWGTPDNFSESMQLSFPILAYCTPFLLRVEGYFATQPSCKKPWWLIIASQCLLYCRRSRTLSGTVCVFPVVFSCCRVALACLLFCLDLFDFLLSVCFLFVNMYPCIQIMWVTFMCVNV